MINLAAAPEVAAPPHAGDGSTFDAPDFERGLLCMQRWLLALKRASKASVDEKTGVIHLAAPIGRRFMLGFSNGETSPYAVLLAMQAVESEWASLLPWSHAGIYADRPKLHVVTERFPLADGDMAPIAIALDFPHDMLPSFDSYNELHLRELVGRETSRMLLRPRALATMPFHIYDHAEDVLSANTRRGFRHRGR